MTGADGPDHALRWGDVEDRYRHPGGGGVHDGGVVGREEQVGVGVDVGAGGGADVPGQGKDPAGGVGAEPLRVLAAGAVEVEGPVAAAGYRGEVELHARAGLQPQEIPQPRLGGDAGDAAVSDVARVPQSPLGIQQPTTGGG